RAASGSARAEADKLRAELEGLNAEAARPVADQRLGVSPGQAAWAQLALAEVNLAAGDPPKARAAIERLKSSQRTTRGLLEAQAALALGLGDVAEAGRLAEQGLARWPSSPGLVAVRARGLLVSGKIDEAATAVAAVTSGADSVDLAIVRGEISIARGDADGATALLDAALAKRPDDLDALVARAEVDLLRNDAHAAQTRLEARYSKQAPPRLTIAYASALRLQKQWQDARIALGRITADGAPGPVTGRAWLELARVERDFGNAKEARAAYGKAQEMLVSRDARREAAVLAIDDGDAIGGRDALRRLLEGAPDDGAVLVETARALVFTGDLEGAKALLDRAADQDATPPAKLARERGRLALRYRDVKRAIAELKDSIAADDRDFEAWILFLDAHLTANDTAGARTVMDDILRKFPNRPDAGLVTGRVALISGRTQDALADFKAAKANVANAPRRTFADACLWVGYAAYSVGDYATARPQLIEATRKEETNADAHGVLGRVYVETEDWPAAATTLARAVELDPENADAWFLLGQARISARRVKEGRTALEHYLKRWPDGERAAEARQLLGR
ncbi:MAG: tetratricopeptide repeat protein, partial [Myxococcales bacterium]|nr:tetratricopeptide repeat protein [Myxococcales bacterium]